MILLCVLTVGIFEEDFSEDITTHIPLKDIHHFLDIRMSAAVDICDRISSVPL